MKDNNNPTSSRTFGLASAGTQMKRPRHERRRRDLRSMSQTYITIPKG